MATEKRSRTAKPRQATAKPGRQATPVRKRRGVSLHVGLNSVDPAHYAGWDGPLAACEFDANDMAALAKARGMQPTVLLTRRATRKAVLKALRAAAAKLAAGDLFFLSYSGHGGQVPDSSGDEPDRKDETWCLFDGQLIDDELYAELARFVPKVRVLVLSDSCHSGSVTRAAPRPVTVPTQRPKLMPDSVAMRVYREHHAFYDGLQRALKKRTGGRIVDPDAALAQVALTDRLSSVVGDFGPACILLSGCQDNQTSMDGEHNGAFTEQLLRVWNEGAFVGSYAAFSARIRSGLPPTQSPNLFMLGKAAAFLRETPFSI